MALRAWFRGTASTASSSPKSASPSRSSTPQLNGGPSLTALERKISDMQDAMTSEDMVMNDDPDGAEARLRLRKDDSSFHQLGLGVVIFMRSILGFEKDIMTEASARLVECETRAWADKEKAERKGPDPGQLFPAGSEFALVYAEALLMNAIVGVLHESLTDAIKGFYKLRRAYAILNKIVEAEESILKAHGVVGLSNGGAGAGTGSGLLREKMGEDQMPGSFDDSEFAEYGIGSQQRAGQNQENNEDEDLEFVDAAEAVSGTETPATYSGHLGKATPGTASETTTPTLEKKLAGLRLDSAGASGSQLEVPATDGSQTPSSVTSQVPTAVPIAQFMGKSGNEASIFTNPADTFVHSGTNMCFGIMMIMLSMVPPAMSRLLSVIGFRGDRDRGLRMLWQSTSYANVNGAVAAMMVLGFYNGFLAFAGILPSDGDIEELASPGEIVGYPRERCADLLRDIRGRYPESRMWKLEEARILAASRRVRDAVEMLESNGDSKMRQVTALNSFELAINSMSLMDWPRTRAAFLRCVELNDWSHSLYYYVAGCAELERYRDAVHALALLEKNDASIEEKQEQDEEAKKAKKAELETSIRKHKKEAEELIRKAPAVAGRKRFMARQMPFEVFVLRKVAKWEARATATGLDLADAIGVSPAQEMIYLWSGSKRMNGDLARVALEGLEWGRCTAPEDQVAKIASEADEAGVRAVCRAPLLGLVGNHEQALADLQGVVAQDRWLFKGQNKEDFVLPAANYELAVLLWEEVCQPERWPKAEEEEVSEDGGSSGGTSKGGHERVVDEFRRKKTDECAAHLETAAKWEAFILDTRLGIHFQTGLETVNWLRRKKGWMRA